MAANNAEKKKAAVLRDDQKAQLDKLMADPDKPVPIPEKPADWKPREAPEFVRFYMGSSAGAGSEVFHVYRHLRRRENIRQQFIEENATKEDQDDAFQERLAWNKMVAEQRTSKKRAKRLKKKQRRKDKKEDEEDEKGNDRPTSPKQQQEEDDEDPHFIIGGR